MKLYYVRKYINFDCILGQREVHVDDFIDDDEDYAANAHTNTLTWQ